MQTLFFFRYQKKHPKTFGDFGVAKKKNLLRSSPGSTLITECPESIEALASEELRTVAKGWGFSGARVISGDS